MTVGATGDTHWIPDTPVVPPSAWTTGVPRMTAGGRGEMTVGATCKSHWIPDTPVPTFGGDWGAENDGGRGGLSRDKPS